MCMYGAWCMEHGVGSEVSPTLCLLPMPDFLLSLHCAMTSNHSKSRPDKMCPSFVGLARILQRIVQEVRLGQGDAGEDGKLLCNR